MHLQAGKGFEEKKAAPSKQISSTFEVSDDEGDDLWEHIASILEARKREGAQSKVSLVFPPLCPSFIGVLFVGIIAAKLLGLLKSKPIATVCLSYATQL